MEYSNVIPIPKKGDSSDPLNFRPVLLLSNVKTARKNSVKNIYNFLMENDLFYKYQSGYSTTYQLIDIYHHIVKPSITINSNVVVFCFLLLFFCFFLFVFFLFFCCWFFFVFVFFLFFVTCRRLSKGSGIRGIFFNYQRTIGPVSLL